MDDDVVEELESPFAKDDGENKARMSDAGLSLETATKRTGLFAGRLRRVVEVDVVGKVDEAAEMRASTLLRLLSNVVVRANEAMVGCCREIVGALSSVEDIPVT